MIFFLIILLDYNLMANLLVFFKIFENDIFDEL